MINRLGAVLTLSGDVLSRGRFGRGRVLSGNPHRIRPPPGRLDGEFIVTIRLVGCMYRAWTPLHSLIFQTHCSSWQTDTVTLLGSNSRKHDGRTVSVRRDLRSSRIPERVISPSFSPHSAVAIDQHLRCLQTDGERPARTTNDQMDQPGANTNTPTLVPVLQS